MRLNVTIPVLNEEVLLSDTVRAVHARLLTDFPGGDWVIVIADNASTDATPRLAQALANEFPEVKNLRLEKRGKGLGVRSGWQAYPAEINVFMDADLATDLEAMAPLVAAVERFGGIAFGSRYHPASEVRRSPFRLLVSHGYRLVFRLVLGLQARDAACGFKAVSAEVLAKVVPQVRDNRWFFDTELLTRAQRAGFRLTEVPVRWREEAPGGRRSRVNVIAVAWQYLVACLSLRSELNDSL
jgi:glycosyltransferase involved in cell wall biosynthesis